MDWINIRNEAGADIAVADIDLFGEIDSWFGIGKKDFIDQVKASNASKLRINISSPGGSVDDALAINDYLSSFSGKVEVNYSGVVASSATLIAPTSSNITMSDNALMMIHNVSGFSYGTAEDLRNDADLMDKFNNRIVNLYQKRTGLRASKLKSLMDDETWMDANEAKDNGFVDYISNNNKKLKNKIDLESLRAKGFSKIPTNKIEILNKTTKKVKKMDLTAIKNEIKEGFKSILDALASKPEAKEMTIEEMVSLASETIENGLKEKYNTIVDSLTSDKTTLTNQITERDAKITDLTTEIEDLKAENDRLKASGVQHVPDKEKQAKGSEGEPELTPADRAAKEFVAGLTPDQRTMIERNAKKNA